MSDNPGATAANLPEIRYERSPFYRMVYSNFFRYLPTPTDFSLTFCKMVGAQPGGAGTLVDEVEITMSYTQLKIVYDHLSAVIDRYEQELGVIEVPATQRPDSAAIENHIALLKVAWGRT